MRVSIVAHTKKVSARQVHDLRQALRGAGITSIECREISKGSAAAKAAKKARKHGADVVVACGGDGTVRAAAQALVGTDTALAVLPVGTANLFASAMSIGNKPDEVADLIARGARRTIDTGRCNDLTFNVMAGAGFDAAMIDDADDHKERLGMLSYLRASAKAAHERTPFDMSVEIDDEPVFEGAASCILVGNIGTLKGGLEAFPDSSPEDGVLDVAVLTASGLRDWANLLFSAVRHRQQLNGHAQLWTARRVTVKTKSEHRFELDGGVKGTTDRLEFEVVPRSLHVCAPSA